MLTIIDRELAHLKMISKDQFKLSPFVMAGPAFSKIQTAEIPAIPGSLNEPCWLLYGIGDGSMVSEARVERLKSRNVNDTVVLFAPSGAGKTRLCMELLWRHYGLFIGVKTGSDKNPGSTAMYDIAREIEETLQRNPEKYEWASLLTDDRPSPLADTLRRDLAIFATNCVLAAYLAIFKALGGANSIDASDWLLVQMYPSHFLGKDRFAMLAKALFNECRELLNLELLRTADETGNSLNHLIVIDEANLLSKFCIERFVTMNESPTRSSLGRRSLISPILAAIRSAMGRSPIISGTGLSLVEVYRSFETAISSVSTFERNCFSDFPRMSFDEVGALLGRVLNLTERERIRASRWLEGRPRFTTDFLHLRLNHMRGTNGEATSFDETLKKYISLMTVGASRYNTLARTPRQALERLKEITQSQQSLEPDRNLRTTALLALFLIEYGVEDIILEDALGLVECGLAFPRPDRSGMKACVVPEPLLLEAGRQSRTEGFLNVQVTVAASSASMMANNFEYVVADRVIPLLVKRPFESNYMINVSIPAIFKGGWSLAGSSYGRVGEYAGNDGERFYRWMDRVLDLEQWSSENPPMGMMMPNRYVGPDVVAVLLRRDERTGKVAKVALMFVHVKLTLNLVGEGAMRTVDPSLFSHTKRDSQQPRVLERFAKDQKAFVTKIANVPVVRVIVSGVSRVTRKIKSGTVKRGRMTDLIIVVDGVNAVELAGREFVDKIKRLKRASGGYELRN